MPVRPHFGINRGELEWRRPNRVTLLNMLHHPIYAGAYRWGHREVDPRKKVPGKPATRSHVQLLRRVPGADSRSFSGVHHVGRIREEPAETGRKQHAGQSCWRLRVTVRACWRGWSSAVVATITCSSVTPTRPRTKTLRYSCLREAIDYGGGRRVRACRARCWSRSSSSGCCKRSRPRRWS